MTQVSTSSSVCVVVLYQLNGIGFNSKIFGVYENEELARKRVEELEFTFGYRTQVGYFTEEVWNEVQS